MHEGENRCFVEPGCHSGQMFDWWRCTRNGIIVKPHVPLPPRTPSTGTRYIPGDLCWPMYLHIPANSTPSLPDEKHEEDCEISRDFWPDKGDRSGSRKRFEHQRPPWVPSKLPNKFGVTNQAPPYTMYRRDRQTVQPQSICSP
ncbi:uncharacterized protein LOC101855443 [Aplysia californica]|uniref:Uncharacterized protein LOC101855443 n=1 Tax=Aplysia californica TaxID=6500 RepID=A0ABM1A872_APLCA|nr:uncharacterized protein LOC101855443 [Aplysia californica]